ncbi:hypothetical protein [uncultured Chryseobacterium sp.]|uniref:hypothetical protein n=1 Tax=uncultured Chryseobacterium sp. TaxID=259322 RepID=UPI00258E00A4|nr:hypothetical protein [uncultured Chryseobacterium sp.]
MKIFRAFVPILLLYNLYACGQIGSHTHKTISKMEYSKINNPTVLAAIEDWQKGDLSKWLSHFNKNATLLDDGHPRDFIKFSTEAIGKEYFTSIDKAENNSRDIYGKFHSDSWGDFKTYFKFRIGSDGKFDQLLIGQADIE